MTIRIYGVPFFLLMTYVSLFFAACKNEVETTDQNPVGYFEIRGMDISTLPEVLSFGNSYYNDQGTKQDFLEIIKMAGVNTVRLRLWHTPNNEHSALEEVTLLSAQCKAAGFKVMISIHYSDTWADPSRQTTPAAWENLDYPSLKDKVYEYTAHVAQTIQPDYIQIGNEINQGFLWNIGSNYHEEQFIGLLNAGIQAVRTVSPISEIIIHYAGHEGSLPFYNVLKKHNLDYDIIGLSYYPMWHGKYLNELAESLTQLGSVMNKKTMIVETSYPFTLDYADMTNNIVGLSSQLLPTFPATPDGQRDYLLEIRKVLNQSKSIGFCYWGGEMIAWRGAQSSLGSSYENQALFDFEHRAVPALKAFQQ